MNFCYDPPMVILTFRLPLSKDIEIYLYLGADPTQLFPLWSNYKSYFWGKVDEILENFTYHRINHLFFPSVLIPVWVGRHSYWLLVYDDHVEATQSLSSQRLRPPFLPPQRRVQCLTFLWLFGPRELWLQDLESHCRRWQPQCSWLHLWYLVPPWNFVFSCTLWLWEL